MGRKSNASKNNDKTPTAENTHPYQERVEKQSSNGNIKSPRALDSQLENPNPRCSPLKHPSLSADGVEIHNERIIPQEHVNQDHENQKKYATFIRKKSKYRGTSVRRSERIKSGVVQTPKSKHDIEYIEDVTVSESEKDESDTQMEQVLPEPEPEPVSDSEPEPVSESEPEPVSEPEPEENPSEKSLDEKVDYVLQRIEAVDKTIELLKSKVDGKIGFYEAPSMTSISYRSIYIDSQKKLEALTDENRQLAGKLENALGKVEVYEKQIRVLIDALDKTKDTVNAVVVSNLAKTTETAVNASTQAILNACSASASKRKRNKS